MTVRYPANHFIIQVAMELAEKAFGKEDAKRVKYRVNDRGVADMVFPFEEEAEFRAKFKKYIIENYSEAVASFLEDDVKYQESKKMSLN